MCGVWLEDCARGGEVVQGGHWLIRSAQINSPTVWKMEDGGWRMEAVVRVKLGYGEGLVYRVDRHDRELSPTPTHVSVLSGCSARQAPRFLRLTGTGSSGTRLWLLSGLG